MGDISRHLSRYEFACKCGCGFDAADKELIEVIEESVHYFENILEEEYLRVFINSGNRCPKHNKDVGGVNTSKHTKGIAVDYRIEHVDADLLFEYLASKYPDRYGIGKYKGRTHMDMRTKPTRWKSED